MADGNVPLADLVTFSNGRSQSAEGTAYSTFGANGVIGTSGEFNAERDTAIIGRVGSYCGAVHYSPDRCWVTDNAIVATAKQDVNPRYVYYLLKRLGLNRYRIGSGQPLLTHGILNRLTVPRLTRAEQDSVAAALGALDDKIAVNGRIAACGDALIRARYGETAPTSRIPIGELGDLARTSVPSHLIGRDENYIALEHMPKRHMWLPAWTCASGVISTKRRFVAGDILFGKLRPYFHKVGLAFVDGVASTDILVVRPKEPDYRGWLLAALSSDEVVAHASAVGDGTRMPRANWADIAAFAVPWPGEGEARRFNEFAATLARRVEAAASESRTLADLRDTLLPKLIP
ncbi:restriction endonuclease subunit S [Actinomadura darangshiensis]|uniref:Restriction endonuclease subunit S n=1 Tax=Actinomadura darangshiensis TaxID=705336 RepID=A0A4R5BKL7_9ACTN|nr:restriction endonuclease subunit S [Actinomadura darangshiensis]TDD85903.1 restriction endonuclease subunit S [Actinomadura darangshiensis]